VTDGGYEVVYEDQFDGDTLGGLWAVAPHGDPLPPTVADGFLTIRTTAANNFSWGYVASTGPRLTTEPSYPYMGAWREGYFEARLRYTDSTWSWPAFWLFSAAKTEAWPDEDCRRLTSEWDIMENGVANWNGQRPAAHSNVSVLHRNTTDGTNDGYCGQIDETTTFIKDFPDLDLSDWHTWGGLWRDGRLCTYIDGVELQCMDAYDTTNQRMHMVFTMLYLRDCGNCGTRPASLEMQVDWVRVWQLPG
jgi:beta-glucanase (GH16 family)